MNTSGHGSSVGDSGSAWVGKLNVVDGQTVQLVGGAVLVGGEGVKTAGHSRSSAAKQGEVVKRGEVGLKYRVEAPSEAGE